MPSVTRFRLLSTAVGGKLIRHPNLHGQARKACAQRSFTITMGSWKLTMGPMGERLMDRREVEFR